MIQNKRQFLLRINGVPALSQVWRGMQAFDKMHKPVVIFFRESINFAVTICCNPFY